jgi:hypothetical protein
MNGLLALLAREVGERRMVFLVAAALSLAPFAAPLLMAGSGSVGSESTLATAVVLALALSSVLAAALGVSIIAGELADRRLAFYFERPLSGWAIWGGKLGAALALALGAGLVVLLPAALLHGNQEPGLLSQLRLAWPAGALLVVLVCHALGVIARARTAWILLDVAAALVVAGLVWFDVHQLLPWPSSFAPLGLSLAAAAILGLVLLSASAVQVIGGRTDLRRAHRLLSSTLWSGLLAPALAATAYIAWYVHPAPTALDMVAYLSADRSGRWVEMAGAARLGGKPEDPRFLPAHFLVDRADGSWQRTGPVGAWRSSHFSPVMFAADGRSAVWLERTGDGSRNELVRIDLTMPHPTPQETRLTFGSPYLALSPDGARIAALGGNRLVVTELATGRLLASVAAGMDSAELVFISPDRLRLFKAIQDAATSPSGELAIDDLDVAGGRLQPLARIPLDAPYTWSASPDGERLLIRTYPGREDHASSLYDAGSGRLLAVLPHTGRGWKQAEFLPSGQLVRIERTPACDEISLLTRDGALAPGTRPCRRGPHSTVVVAGQASATELLAMESAPLAPLAPSAPGSRTSRGRKGQAAALDLPAPFRLIRLDLARGTAVELARGVARSRDFLPRPLAGRSPAFLAHTAQGWAWIDAAGRRTPLVAGGG